MSLLQLALIAIVVILVAMDTVDSVSFRRGLFVDDDDATRLVLRKLLEHLGIECVVAGGVQEAINWLQKEQFAFLVTDLQMAGGGGLVLLEWAQQKQPELRTALMSGAISPQARHSALRFGARAFLTKPIASAELSGLLTALGVVSTVHARLKKSPLS